MQYRDARVRGLGVLIQATGHRSFYWFKKVRGFPRWQTIGVFPDITVDQARAAAEERNIKLARWKERNYEGPDPFERGDAVETLDSLVDEYIARHLREHAKNPDDAEGALRWMIRKYLPSWRARPLNTIRPDDVARFHRNCGKDHGHRTANMVVKKLTTLFNFAKRAKLYQGELPTEGIQFYRETSRKRFLQPAELPNFLVALRKMQATNPDLVDYVTLALWTGARKSDVMSMRWQDISLAENNCQWTIPNPKSREPYVVPLTDEAVTILKDRLRSRSSVYVFPGRGASGHLVDLKRGWKKLLKDAKLDFPDQPELRVRQHDLRRTQGSYQAALGASLLIIGASLGHQSTDATQIYSQLNLAPVRASMTASNAAISAAMKAKPKQLKAGKTKAAPRD